MTQNRLDLSINQIFPYSSPNIYQKELLSQDISSSKQVIIEAPVGSGKTIAVLSLAILEAINNNLRGIIILTRTHSQMKNFLKELSLINNHILVPYLGFIGKIHLCRFKQDPIAREIIKFQGGCNAYACPFKESYDNMINRELKARNIWNNNKESFLSIRSISEHINTLSIFEGWCPYYLQKELLRYSRVIVTTYANGSKQMLEGLENSLGFSLDNFIIIIDEAHNFSIPDKIVLPLDWISKGFNLIKAGELTTILKDKNETWGFEVSSKIVDAISRLDQYIFDKLKSQKKDIPPFIYESRLFLEKWYEGVATIDNNNAIAIVPEIKKRLDLFSRAAKTILISATISPFNVYSSIFGFNNPKLIKIEEKQKNRRIFYCLKSSRVTSKYSERNFLSYKKMSEIISKIEAVSRKKVLIMAPSYEYASSLSSYLNPLYVETPETSLEEIKEIIFKDNSNKLVIAVNSGKILEGFDLVSSSGSVFDIVIFSGLPFTPPSWEKKVMKKYFSGKFSESFSTILIEHLPVVRSLLQAIGRTTRNETEKGLGIILDYRVEWISKYIPIKVFQDIDALLLSAQRFLKDF